MNLQEATVKAIKEDKATNNELHNMIRTYRNTLKYLEKLYDTINGEDTFDYDLSCSDKFYEAEENLLEILLDEESRIEKLLNRAESDFLNK